MENKKPIKKQKTNKQQQKMNWYNYEIVRYLIMLSTSGNGFVSVPPWFVGKVSRALTKCVAGASIPKKQQFPMN